jgi:MFS family permease
MVRALVFAALVVSVQTTLGAPLIPTIAAEHGVSLQSAQWVMTVTLLVSAVATPLASRLGDGPQRRNVLLGALATSAAGCVVAATTASFGQVVAGRALQGVGYAIVPLAMAILRDELEGDALRRSVGVLAITAAVGAGLGFPITGLIAERSGADAAFWFGGGFSLVALAVVTGFVPRRSRARRRPVRLDLVGALTLGGGLALMLLGVTESEHAGWGSTRVIVMLTTGAALLGLWAFSALRVEQPLVDLRLAGHRTVLSTNVCSLLLATAMYGALSLVNLLAQTPADAGYGFAASPFQTGLLLLPLAAGSALSQAVVRLASGRFGPSQILTGGAVLLACTLTGLAASHDRIPELAVGTMLFGLCIGCTFAVMPPLIMAVVPPERTASAMGLNQVTRAVGGALGSALSVTALTAFAARGAAVPEHAYTVTFALGAGLCAVTAVISRLSRVPNAAR